MSKRRKEGREWAERGVAEGLSLESLAVITRAQKAGQFTNGALEWINDEMAKRAKK